MLVLQGSFKKIGTTVIINLIVFYFAQIFSKKAVLAKALKKPAWGKALI